MSREELPRHLQWLAPLGPELRRFVVASLQSSSYSFGTVVTREGDVADSIYVVAEGTARVVATGPGHREVSLDLLHPGDTFGEVALVTDGQQVATLRASGDLVVLRLDGSIARALMASNADVRRWVQQAAQQKSIQYFLRSQTRLAALPDGTLRALAEAYEPLDLRAGDLISAEAQREVAYLVQEGRLQAVEPPGNEAQMPTYFCVGDLVNQLSGDTRLSPTRHLVAATGTRLLTLTRQQVEQLCAAFDGLNEDLAEAPTKRRGNPQPPEVIEQGNEPTPATREAYDRLTPLTSGSSHIRNFRLLRAFGDMDCGAACLAMVCRHYGQQITLPEARRLTGAGIDGISLQGLVHGAKTLGLDAEAVKLSRRNLDSVPLPAILHWEGNHWVVAWQVTKTAVRVADPSLGQRKVTRDEINRGWTGYAAVFAPRRPRESRRRHPRRPSWLWAAFRTRLAMLLVAAVLALVVAALQMSLPVFFQIVVDRILPSGDVSLLRTLLLILAGVFIAMIGGTLLQRLLLSRAAVDIDRTALNFLTGRLLALPLHYFYARRAGDIQRRLAGLRTVRDFAVRSGVMALTAAAQLTAALALMAHYSRTMTAVFLALAPLYAMAMLLALTRMRPLLENLEESLGMHFSKQIDTVKGIETVKAVAGEAALQQELDRDFQVLARRLFRADFASMAYDGMIQLLSFASLGLYLWAGTKQVLKNKMTIGELVSFNTLVLFANSAIVVILWLWDDLQHNAVLLNRLGDLLDEESEYGMTSDSQTHQLGGGIEVTDLSFAYQGVRTRSILQDVNLSIKPGSMVAIVGRSGSGKSTLARCIGGLLQPTRGEVRFDGVLSTAVDIRALRRQIGMVLQDTYILSKTITENIALGDSEPDMHRVRWAAQAAHADGFVRQLPFGYETKIGEAGLLLSGGERQRIAIARALYRRPAILILDEATSSLDVESEQAVQVNLDQMLRGSTLLVIAHRLSTVRSADTIVVLDRGRLVERGSHEELIARRGLYFHLAEMQLDI